MLNPSRRRIVRRPRMLGCRARAAAAGAALAVATGGCASPTPPLPQKPATLTVTAPAETGTCAPDRLVRCVPGLADIEPNLFDMVNAYPPDPSFAALPPSSARESAPKDCQYLPNLGGNDAPALDVDYRPATGPDGKPFGARFPANNGEYFHVRFIAAGNGDDIATAMNHWAHQCPMWGFSSTLNANGIQGWMIAESADRLTKYQSGDIDEQWFTVTHTAATVLPNGVIVQADYRTTDPSAASRNHVLSAILRAAGQPRPRSALPSTLAQWGPAQISTLLPPLAPSVTIDAAGGQPDNRWLLCPEADHGPTPLYDPQASWRGPIPPEPARLRELAPIVTIDRARAGIDYLAQIRREIITCTIHLAETPEQCTYAQFHQSLAADSTVADGEDILRITHRWIRVEKVQGYDRCVEGAQALRIAQVRGLIVISRVDYSSVKGEVGDPPLILGTLDELIAQTVHTVKAA
jgi:hypothetical protein